MEIGLPRGTDGELQFATVKREVLDTEGRSLGKSNNNPILDCRKFEVQYLDGSTEVLAANTIAENIMAQVDDNGHRELLIDEIVDYRYDETALSEDDVIMNSSGEKFPKLPKTTKGWQLFVQWKDGSGQWVSLKDLKDSYPVQVAEYALQANIHNKPAFAWWVPYTLKKRQSIISKIKTKYWQRTHKYGIRIPKSVKEAIEIDRENGNTLWQDAIALEMKNVRVAFQLCEGDPRDLVGYKSIKTHMIFDVKLGENFRRKARLVADGHMTKTPTSMTYSSVVSRDSIHICLLLAALDDLDIRCADIKMHTSLHLLEKRSIHGQALSLELIKVSHLLSPRLYMA